MKKTIISKNYSLLILILLILYLTYTSLPEDTNYNMRGGALDLNNPYLTMDEEDLAKQLAKHSAIYSFLKNYIYVYGGIVFVLLLITGYFAKNQYEIQGIPAFGIEPGMTWDSEGMNFFNYFYFLSKKKYGLLPPNENHDINPELVKNFESDFDKFMLTNNGEARQAVDLFCNTVAPCNLCSCSGPDPNYAGKIENTPMVSFKDPKYKVPGFGYCVPKNDTGKPGPADAANNVVQNNLKRGVSDLIFGRIPDCCCQLWKKALGDKANFTAPKLQAFVNALPTRLGISPATGCEPMDPGNAPSLSGSVDGKEVTITPHKTPSGANKYMYDMVISCSMKQKLADLSEDKFTFGKTNNTVSTLSPAFIACGDYDPLLDEGISPAFVAKNASRFITPSIGATPSGADLKDVSKDWTTGLWTQTTGRAPNLAVTKPANWPTVAPFNADSTVNSFWYKSSSGILYELTVYNKLYQVQAYPVITVSNYYTNELTDATAKAYLDSFLSTAALAADPKIFVYGGSYYIP